MPVNKYFNTSGLNFDAVNEQDLINDLTTEIIQINGIDVIYLPRTMQKQDTLFGEDVLSLFDDNYPIEMNVDSIDNFEGEGDLMAKFGLQIKDELNLTVGTRRFSEIVGFLKPREGDLIYFPLSKGLFEIKFVEDEEPFYPVGTLPSFKLRCELFDYSAETFDTGHTEIDELDNLIDLEHGGEDPFDDSTTIESEGDDYIDFTENNPFGNV